MNTHSQTNYASKTLNYMQKQMNIKISKNKLVCGKFNMIYLNINSIQHKLDDLESLIYEFNKHNNKKTIHFIALTEVRIEEQQAKFFNIPSYTSFFCTRADGYGGCGLLVHNTLSSNLIDKKSNANIELLSVNIVELSICITVVYKQPAVSSDTFIDTFQNFIDNKKTTIVIGDTNIDLLKDTNSTRCYLDAIVASGLTILNPINAKYATRVATKRNNDNTYDTSKTIIDHVITDRIRFSFNLSIAPTEISDHMLLLLSFDNNKSNEFLSQSTSKIISKLDSSYDDDIQHYLNCSNISSFNEFITGLEDVKNRHIETFTHTNKSNPTKPWINVEMLALTKERNRYFQFKKKSPSNQFLIDKLTELNKQIKTKRFILRTKYNSEIINKNLNNPKKMWCALNEIIYNKNRDRNVIKALYSQNGNTTMNKSINMRHIQQLFQKCRQILARSNPIHRMQSHFAHTIH